MNKGILYRNGTTVINNLEAPGKGRKGKGGREEGGRKGGREGVREGREGGMEDRRKGRGRRNGKGERRI